MRKILFLLALPMLGQNYAGYSTYPVARMSFLRHQFSPQVNALEDPSLLGYWVLNEGAGAVAYDSSAHHNAAWTGTQAGTLGYYSAGKTASYSGYFDGSTAYATVAGIATTAISNITIMGWIYWLGTTSSSQASIYNGNSSTNGYGLLIANTACGSGSVLAVLLGQITCSVINSPPSITQAKWTHVAAVLATAGAWTMYVNGASAGTGSGNPYGPTGATNIGGNGGTFLKGQMNDLRVYNRALSLAEIQAIYNAENH